MKGEPVFLSEKLAHFLLGCRTTPHTATGCTPAELLMGRRIRIRLDLLHPNLSSRISEKSREADHSTRRMFETGEPVIVRDYRSRKSSGIKGVIQDRLGPITYRVQVEDLLWKRQVDQLRSLAGLKAADTESLSKVPEVGHARDPEGVPLSQP